jgi:hypothetical protein
MRAIELDLEHGALGQAQGIPHCLGQGDLSTLGNRGFHLRLRVIRKIRYA